MSEETKSQVDILRGEPVTVCLLGKEVVIKRMTFDKQESALKVISDVYADRSDSVSSMQIVSKLALAIVAHASGISIDELKSKGDLVEILTAFRKIWKQNGFDFLADAVADLFPTG